MAAWPLEAAKARVRVAPPSPLPSSSLPPGGTPASSSRATQSVWPRSAARFRAKISASLEAGSCSPTAAAMMACIVWQKPRSAARQRGWVAAGCPSTSIDAPLLLSHFRAAPWLLLAANDAAVQPSELSRSSFAPAATSSSIRSTCPSLAATIRAVTLASSAASTAAPESSKSDTISRELALQAAINAVKPDSELLLGSMFMVSSRSLTMGYAFGIPAAHISTFQPLEAILT
mmetsp:Transcript_18169/g.50883  ORF Transcript_18169/g.50883 Transcript_18169/m.50883 type:complete len:232 (-) Transcript_18169:443-1138(-)